MRRRPLSASAAHEYPLTPERPSRSGPPGAISHKTLPIRLSGRVNGTCSAIAFGGTKRLAGTLTPPRGPALHHSRSRRQGTSSMSATDATSRPAKQLLHLVFGGELKSL